MNAHQRRTAKRLKKSRVGKRGFKLYPHQTAAMEHMRRMLKDNPTATMEISPRSIFASAPPLFDLESMSENRLSRLLRHRQNPNPPIVIHEFVAGDIKQHMLRLERHKPRLKIGNNPTEFRFPKASDFEYTFDKSFGVNLNVLFDEADKTKTGENEIST